MRTWLYHCIFVLLKVFFVCGCTLVDVIIEVKHFCKPDMLENENIFC